MRAMSQTTRSGGWRRILRHELMLGKQPLQLAAEEEVDPHEQDRRHAWTLAGPKDGSRPRRQPHESASRAQKKPSIPIRSSPRLR